MIPSQTIKPTHLAAIVTTDLSGITRGRFMPAEKIETTRTGIGWVPANISLKANGDIVADNIWGSSGDLRVLPDLKARYQTELTGAPTPFDMTMGDIVNLDGTPWCACTRTALKDAVKALEEATGLRLLCSFEQEFQILDTELTPAHPFSYQALRRAEPFIGQYYAALEDAGIEPEVIIAEYGEQQFEVTSSPTDPLTATDRCIAIREITREMARLEGWHATFAPKSDPDGIGNGVHIHFSFVDKDGLPAGFDASKPGRLSDKASAFCAGLLKHMPAYLAISSSSPASFIRLQPHHWSSAWTWLGDKDREASLRICPTVEISGTDPARQFNIEYRAADATSNPYLALAALIRAGLDGIQSDIGPAEVFSGDPEALSDEDRKTKGLFRLPTTLNEAVDALEASDTLKTWFSPELLTSFIGIKRDEANAAKRHGEKAICATCARQY